MAVCSVDLGLSAELDDEVRAQWLALADAGLPSQAGHRSDTNAPHITLAQRAELPPPEVSGRAASHLPVALTLAGVLLLPTRRGHVLARSVTPTEPLLRLHREVARLVGEAEPPAVHTAVGSWTPHVTLAVGLEVDEVAHALDVLDLSATHGHGTELRHWVPATRTLTTCGRTGTTASLTPHDAPNG